LVKKYEEWNGMELRIKWDLRESEKWAWPPGWMCGFGMGYGVGRVWEGSYGGG